MCWTGNLNLEKTKVDIPVFKIMIVGDKREIVYSYYCRSQYNIGELKTSEIISDGRDMYSPMYYQVKIALHSYNLSKFKIWKRMSSLIISNIESGHAVDSYPFYCCNVVKGIIPKGAYYCENEEGEIISDKLIMTEICGHGSKWL